MRTYQYCLIALSMTLAFGLTACSPEVGSEDWCTDMKATPKGDWTLQQTADFTKHCIVRLGN